MGFTHRSNRTGLHQFHHAPIVISRMNLGPHLGRHLGFISCFTNHACFPDVMSQWFFTVDMFTHLQGGQRREGVGVFARTHRHGIEFIDMVIQVPKINRFPGTWMTSGSEFQVVFINITHRHDVL